MANLPKIKNTTILQRNFKQNLESRAKLTNANSDSVTRSIYLPIVGEMERMNTENREVFESLQVSTASGADLDVIASEYGITRLMAGFAYVPPDQFNFMFYTSTTFGDINGGNDIIVPKGTIVTSGMTAKPNAMVYETTEEYILKASQSKQYCSIAAKNIGSNHNANKGALNMHKFRNYVDVNNGSLQCTNRYPIINGRNLETDDSLRFRINRFYSSIVTDSEQSLMLKSLEVPGVLDIKVFPNYYGIGTVGIFVFGAAKRSNIQLVEEVERKLSLTKPPGITYYVTQGIAVYVDLEITVYVNTKLESEKKTGLIANINSNVKAYMSNINGSVLNLVDLRDTIINSNPDIIGMTDPEDRLSVFDGVYIRKAYGEGALTSERIKFEMSSINILSSEFFTLGTLEINFEENF